MSSEPCGAINRTNAGTRLLTITGNREEKETVKNRVVRRKIKSIDKSTSSSGNGWCPEGNKVVCDFLVEVHA